MSSQSCINPLKGLYDIFDDTPPKPTPTLIYPIRAAAFGCITFVIPPQNR